MAENAKCEKCNGCEDKFLKELFSEFKPEKDNLIQMKYKNTMDMYQCMCKKNYQNS